MKLFAQDSTHCTGGIYEGWTDLYANCLRAFGQLGTARDTFLRAREKCWARSTGPHGPAPVSLGGVLEASPLGGIHRGVAQSASTLRLRDMLVDYKPTRCNKPPL